jgi:pimeloyl-ACP methyl ester carboxylesterase
MEAAMQSATLVPVATGVRLNVSQTGTGEPLLLIMGTSGSPGFWEPLVAPFAEHHRVIAYDNRGLGLSERGDARITMASLATDAAALLDALEIERAHVLGWSLGSAVAQELALAHPDRVGGLVLYATWGRGDGYMRAWVVRCERGRSQDMARFSCTPIALSATRPRLAVHEPRWKTARRRDTPKGP